MIIAEIDFVDLLKNFGLPVVLLFALGIFIYKIAVWGKGVLDRLADRHIKFVDQIAVTMEKQAEALKINSENLVKISEAIIEISKNNRDTLARMETVARELSGVTTNLSEVKNIVLKTDSVTVVPSRRQKNDPSSG